MTLFPDFPLTTSSLAHTALSRAFSLELARSLALRGVLRAPKTIVLDVLGPLCLAVLTIVDLYTEFISFSAGQPAPGEAPVDASAAAAADGAPGTTKYPPPRAPVYVQDGGWG